MPCILDESEAVSGKDEVDPRRSGEMAGEMPGDMPPALRPGAAEGTAV